MSDAYSSAGISRGTRVGLENVRQRRYQAAQDALAAKERERRHEMEDFSFGRARIEAGQSDTDRVRRLGDEDFTRARERVGAEREDTTFAQSQEDRARDLARTETLEGREDTTFAQGQEDRQRELNDLMQQAQNEGMQEFVTSLMRGGDPNISLQRFNRTGQWKIIPQSFYYDRSTGLVRFTDSDGDTFEGSLDELAGTFGVVPEKQEPIQLGKDERLVDPTTHETLVEPMGAGEGGGRETSSYNPETAGNQITQGIARSRGAQLDVLGNWSIADPGDRRVVDYMVALGSDMEGRLRSQVSSGELSVGEIVNAVTEAAKNYQTDSELEKRAEEWRTSWFNKTQEQARAWMTSERARQDGEVRARLAEAEQRLLGRRPQSQSDASLQEPAEPKSQEEFNALPSGRRFRAPDGSIRIKP